MRKNNTLETIRRSIAPHSDSPYLDAQVLLSELLDRPRSYVLAHPDQKLNPEQRGRLQQMVSRIQQGIPLPYVIGHWKFYGMDFLVTPHVLIPRPETERLVEKARDWLTSHPDRRWAADLGTGSGCIAVSLAKSFPDLHLLAVDLSWKALKTAAANVERHGTSRRIHLLQGDLLAPINRPLDLLIANLPYIPREKLIKLPVYGNEPTLALNGGRDGLEVIHKLLRRAPGFIQPGGLVLLEIDEGKGPEAFALARNYFPAAEIVLEQDLSGQDRFVFIQTQENQL